MPPGRGQQFFGGDLDGIVEHLDHIAALGVTMIYHTPIFPAESNHRYDAARFDEVDPLLGGDAAYLRLIEAAHARGIRIMGDLTSNHSGSAHEWFRAAHRHPEAPESAFYYFLDDENEDYESWLGAPTLPKFDWTSEELRRRFIDGPGLDRREVAPAAVPHRRVAHRRREHDRATRRRSTSTSRCAGRIRRTMIEIEPETLLVAESTNDAASDLQGDAWHGAMTYPAFTRGLWAWLSDPTGIPHINAFGEETDEMWYFGIPTGMPAYDATQFVAQMQRFTSQLPWRVRLGSMLPLDTHDTARFATRALPGTIPLAVGLSMTLPGIPVVFAGDEFGLTGVDGEMSRTPIPWERVDDPDIAERIALYRALIGSATRASRARRRRPALAARRTRGRGVRPRVGATNRCSWSPLVTTWTSRCRSAAVSGAASAAPLFGEATMGVAVDGGVVLSADGPAFAVWSLPGVAAPVVSATKPAALPQAGGIADAEIAALEGEE